MFTRLTKNGFKKDLPVRPPREFFLCYWNNALTMLNVQLISNHTVSSSICLLSVCLSHVVCLFVFFDIVLIEDYKQNVITKCYFLPVVLVILITMKCPFLLLFINVASKSTAILTFLTPPLNPMFFWVCQVCTRNSWRIQFSQVSAPTADWISWATDNKATCRTFCQLYV